MYRLSVFLCFFFASLVIALFTLIVSDDTFTPGSDNAAILVQDLTSLRAWVVVIGLVVFFLECRHKEAKCPARDSTHGFSMGHVLGRLHGPRQRALHSQPSLSTSSDHHAPCFSRGIDIRCF